MWQECNFGFWMQFNFDVGISFENVGVTRIKYPSLTFNEYWSIYKIYSLPTGELEITHQKDNHYHFNIWKWNQAHVHIQHTVLCGSKQKSQQKSLST